MKKIKINSEELTIDFNFATEIGYEQLTGKAFDPAAIFPNNGIANTTDAIELAIACLIVNNRDIKTDGHYILYNASRDEVKTLLSAVFSEMVDWLNIPSVAEQHVPEDQDKDEEDKNPNV